MKETPQDYMKRILGYVEGQDALRVQARTPKRLESLIKGKVISQLRKRPAADKWSVVEILAHLADCEVVNIWRMRQILSASGTPIQAFDQEAWAAIGHYRKCDPRQSAERFGALRQSNLALFKSLEPEQWECYGMHAERGKETIAHLARLIAGHDINHLRQIERLTATNR